MNRQAFEIFISSPPFEKGIERFPADSAKYPWPGAYRDITVELAWECWKEAERTAIARMEAQLAAAEAKLPRWIPVGEQMPKDKKPIYMIALVPERNYTTDQYAGWYTLGKWTRWPHRFPPTHWSYQIDNPEGDL